MVKKNSSLVQNGWRQHEILQELPSEHQGIIWVHFSLSVLIIPSSKIFRQVLFLKVWNKFIQHAYIYKLCFKSSGIIDFITWFKPFFVSCNAFQRTMGTGIIEITIMVMNILDMVSNRFFWSNVLVVLIPFLWIEQWASSSILIYKKNQISFEFTL